MDFNEMAGRLVVVDKSEEKIMSSDNIEVYQAIKIFKNKIKCNRCGKVTTKERAKLPYDNYYCPKCIVLGRVSTLNNLVHVIEDNHFNNVDEILTWDGELSKFQEVCSNELINIIGKNTEHLLWAVTGAGKMEMLFKPIAEALRKNFRVAIASPRVDVCNELYPRLNKAFKEIDKVLLHGRSEETYRYTQLVVCTTHQLLKFKEAFDVLIIDEVDAFPYVNNKELLFATKQAIKKTGTLIYLTATPSNELAKKIKRGNISISYLPMRFHQNALPTIKVEFANNWWELILQGKLDTKIKKYLKKWQQNGKQFLIFVPHVAMLNKVRDVIKGVLASKIKGDTVHAADEYRIEKVQKMRNKEYTYLITTTILERGVTFPEIDLLVLGADNSVFSTSALVQIAGRVGRSVSRPDGDVIFICDRYTRKVKDAQKQIEFLNKKAKKLREGIS